MNANSKDEKQRLAPGAEAKRKTKKPYVKPDVQFERVFETMALTCGKVQATQFSCVANRRAS